MIKAYKIYTGCDGHTHIVSGTVAENELYNVRSISFRETAPHSTYDWHTAPIIQYVITLSGTLEFETFTGEKFILKPGEILIAMDTTGSGHKWKIVDDSPWKRVYITFDAESAINFVEDILEND